jgi:hypothetical protein
MSFTELWLGMLGGNWMRWRWGHKMPGKNVPRPAVFGESPRFLTATCCGRKRGFDDVGGPGGAGKFGNSLRGCLG